MKDATTILRELVKIERMTKGVQIDDSCEFDDRQSAAWAAAFAWADQKDAPPAAQPVARVAGFMSPHGDPRLNPPQPYLEWLDKRELPLDTLIYAAPATQPLTEEQIGKHTLLAGDCPPASEVLLVSSVRRLQAKNALAAPAAPAPAPDGFVLVPVEPTDAMITAYLTANDAYWREVDALPFDSTKPWRQGTSSEATRVSLKAALAARPAAQEQKP